MVLQPFLHFVELLKKIWKNLVGTHALAQAIMEFILFLLFNLRLALIGEFKWFNCQWHNMFCYVYKKKVDLEFLGQAGLVLCLRHIKGFSSWFYGFWWLSGKPLEHTVLFKFLLAPCYISFVLIGCFGKFGFCLHQTIKPSNHQTIKPSNHQTIKLHSVKCTVKC